MEKRVSLAIDRVSRYMSVVVRTITEEKIRPSPKDRQQLAVVGKWIIGIAGSSDERVKMMLERQSPETLDRIVRIAKEVRGNGHTQRTMSEDVQYVGF